MQPHVHVSVMQGGAEQLKADTVGVRLFLSVTEHTTPLLIFDSDGDWVS